MGKFQWKFQNSFFCVYVVVMGVKVSSILQENFVKCIIIIDILTDVPHFSPFHPPPSKPLPPLPLALLLKDIFERGRGSELVSSVRGHKCSLKQCGGGQG